MIQVAWATPSDPPPVVHMVPGTDIPEKNCSEQGDLWGAEPGCTGRVVSGHGGGVVCTKCGGWFCY